MYKKFEELNENSRVWVYTADRSFTKSEVPLIEEYLKNFAESWSAHGHGLTASYEIREEQFIVLAVDESSTGTSGCSIDSSVHAMKGLGAKLGIDLVNRSLVPFSMGNQVLLISRKDLSIKLQEGIWNEDTPTFNTLASDVRQLRERWLVRAGDSWLRSILSRYVSN